MPRPLRNWLDRHKSPASFWLHMMGVPACFVAAPAMLVLQEWVLAGVLFVGGYAMQFLGHLAEGNTSGEGQLLRKLMGRR